MIGADGLHSTVRRLRFGAESAYLRELGYYVAVFTTDNFLGLDRRGQMFNVPGRAAGVYSARDNTVATVMMVFASPPIDHDQRDVAQQMQVVTRAYTASAEVPGSRGHAVGTRLLLRRHQSRSSPALVERPGRAGRRWPTGRPRAAWERVRHVRAYVLAGEIAAARGDHGIAFARYEQIVRPYATRAQESGRTWAGRRHRSTAGIWVRNMVLRVLPSCRGDTPSEGRPPRRPTGSSCRTIRRSVGPSRKARSKSRTSCSRMADRPPTMHSLCRLTDMDDKKAYLVVRN